MLCGAAAVQVDLTAYAMQVELTAFTKVWLAMTEQFYQAAIDNAVEGVAQACTSRLCVSRAPADTPSEHLTRDTSLDMGSSSLLMYLH